MGCASSKILMRTGSLKEEFQKRLRRRTDSYEEIIISKNGTEQFVAVLCSSRSNTVPTKMIKEHESSTQASLQKEEVEELENSIETINIWELLAGLEDENEDKVIEKLDSETSEVKSINPIKVDSETGEVEKGFKRKMVAKELTAIRVPPVFEFARTGSLRDWLSQGGQVFSPESYVTPSIGSSEYASLNKEDFFDPNLVLQLEEAMEDMTLEEEKILRQIT